MAAMLAPAHGSLAGGLRHPESSQDHTGLAAECLPNHRERPSLGVEFGRLFDLSPRKAPSTQFDAAVSEQLAYGALAEPMLVGQAGSGRAGEVGRYDLFNCTVAEPIGSPPWGSLRYGLPFQP